MSVAGSLDGESEKPSHLCFTILLSRNRLTEKERETPTPPSLVFFEQTGIPPLVLTKS